MAKKKAKGKKVLELLKSLPEDQVAVVEVQLLTSEQALVLQKRDIEVADVLNGNFGVDDKEVVASIVDEWNKFLGEDHFVMQDPELAVAVNQIAEDVDVDGKEVECKKQKALQNEINKSVGTVTNQAGEEVEVSPLDIASSRMRNLMTQILKDVDLAAYKAYKGMKYKNGPNPDLATRKEAYMFAFKAFLDVTYKKAGV